MDYEQEVAREIAAALGVDARRGYQRRVGGEEPDVTGLPDLWWPECKYGADAKMGAVLEQGWTQAESASPQKRPVLIFRRQRAESRVVLRLSDFLSMVGLLEQLLEQRTAEIAPAEAKEK